jgi:antitoxin component YwqK of YwqJK toxin-antitoxin module
LILLCLPMIGFGQIEYIQTDSLSSLDSVNQVFYDNGNLRAENIYRFGILNRWETRMYNENGNLQFSEGRLGTENGSTRDGNYVGYYASGRLGQKGRFKMGDNVGKNFVYYETGEKKRLRVYSKDGSGGKKWITQECYDKESNLITCED